MAEVEAEEPSYIDYETFTSPSFKPAQFANSLVLATNNPTDVPLDLSTPLSRVLFDAQEIDSHIDLLTTRSAIPLLTHTAKQTSASKRIIAELDAQIAGLNESYKQLEREVIDKHAEADHVRAVAERLWEALRMAKAAARCLQLGRQLEIQFGDISRATPTSKEDHGALVKCAHTILSLREVLDAKNPGEEGFGLGRVDAVKSLLEVVVIPTERSVRETAERLVREFSISTSTTFSQGEEARARLISAMTTLYLLSPTNGIKPDKWTPRLLLSSLETYIRSALQSSVTTLSRSLGQLPSLDKALSDVVIKCQNIISLELILESTKAPVHPLFPTKFIATTTTTIANTASPSNLLQPLCAHLETGSLPSYFWRSMAGSISGRVQEITNRGGVVARTLKSNKSSVGDAIKQAVLNGSQLPGALARGSRTKRTEVNWDREIAVMVGSVVNNLGR